LVVSKALVLGKADRDDAGGAAHAPEVETHEVGPHAELGGRRRGRFLRHLELHFGKEAAINVSPRCTNKIVVGPVALPPLHWNKTWEIKKPFRENELPRPVRNHTISEKFGLTTKFLGI